MSRLDRDSSFTNVIAIVTNGSDLGGRNATERLSSLWVSKDHDCGNTLRIRGRGALGGIVYKLSTLAIAGKNDLGVGAAAGSLETR